MTQRTLLPKPAKAPSGSESALLVVDTDMNDGGATQDRPVVDADVVEISDADDGVEEASDAELGA